MYAVSESGIARSINDVARYAKRPIGLARATQSTYVYAGPLTSASGILYPK